MKKILITGGAGCIGIEVYKQCLSIGLDPIIFDLSEKITQLSKYFKPKKYIKGSILDKSLLLSSLKNIDCVVHLAALLGVKRTESEPQRCLEINIEDTKNVIETACLNNVKKLVFASSSEVYGQPAVESVNEETVTQGRTVYAISKLAAEEYIKATTKFSNLKSVILRYFNTFGSFQTAEFVISRFLYLARKGERIVINGDGKQIRSYCYVTDTANATVKSIFYNIKNKDGFEIFNIGNPLNKINVLDLGSKILTLCHSSKKPKFDLNFQINDRIRNREIFQRTCNIDKAKSFLDYSPQVNLESALKDLIKNGIIWKSWPQIYP